MMTTMERPAYMVPAVSSLTLHLVFGLMIGGFWLAKESPPEPKPVEFKIIEKKPLPEKEEIKKKLLEPKPIEVPVVEPLKLSEPVQRQQVVQPVRQFQKQEVMPLQMDQLPTVSNQPQVAMRKPRAAVTPSRTIQAVQAAPVTTASKATGAVSVRKPRVRAMTMPTLAPKTMTQVAPSTGSRRVQVRTGARRAITTAPSAPVTMAPISESKTQQSTAPVSAPKAAPVRTAPVQAVTAQPVVEAPPAPPAATTDQGALNAYTRRLGIRVQKVGIQSYKRSPLRRTNKVGRVILGFTVLRSGEIKNIRVVTKSRYEKLDQLAIDSLKKAAPFAEFPDGIVEDERLFTIPLRFELR